MELRKDYILDRWVIIATDRKKRPKQFKKEDTHEESTCFFCPGNEHLTPPEIGRVPLNDSWKIRWFPNKFPAVEPKGNPEIQTHDTFFTFSEAYGHHEVIAETPDHSQQLWNLSVDDLYGLFKIYQHRIHELQKQPNIKYVVLFKNHGAEAGTSLIHSHTQTVAQNIIPEIISKKAELSENSCPYCNVLNIEKDSDRRCFENDSFVAFTPYASRFNMEIWVMPKRHINDLDQMEDHEFKDMAEIMNKVLSKLKELNAPYNYYLHYSPPEKNLHLHIEITPRLSKWAGYEFSTGIIINSIPPEDAAKFYRGEEV